MDIKSFFALTLLRLLGLFTLNGARRFGVVIAWLLRITNSTLYRVTQKNLSLVYPEMTPQAREQLARASLYHTGCSLAETGIAWGGTLDQLRANEAKVVKIQNEHLLADAVTKGKGVLMLTLHFGNWEWMNAVLPQRSPNLMALYKMAKMPALEKNMLDSRQACGVTMVPGTREGVERFIDNYRAGNCCLIAPDQEPSTRSGIWAEFFGLPALTPRFIHQLTQENPEGTVLFVYMKRVPAGFELVFLDADPEIYADDIVTAANAMNRGFERCVADDPAQYQWDYKRFKRNPEKYYKGL